MGSMSFLLKTSVLLAGGSQASDFSSIMFLGHDPVDSWVTSDGVVSWVNTDNLKEFLGGILTHPVGVKNSQVGAVSSDLLLSNISVRSSLLELSDTLMDWLSVDATLVHCSLSSTSSDSASVDDVSLLLLESKSSGLVQSAGSSDLVDDSELSVLPASDSHDETHDI